MAKARTIRIPMEQADAILDGTPWKAKLWLLLCRRAAAEPWNVTVVELARLLAYPSGARMTTPDYPGLTRLVNEWADKGWIVSTKASTGTTISVTGLTPNANIPAREYKINWTPATGWQGITDADKARWRAAYPSCDLDRQLAAMDAWLRANPTKAIKRNFGAFITNWLSRSQARGGDAKGGKYAPVITSSISEEYER
jgi:hypothetical protein